MKENYDFYWIGRCQYGSVDKVWGIFYYKDGSKNKSYKRSMYAFWGAVGKRVTISGHHNQYYVSNLVSKKEQNKYVKISPAELEAIFHNLYENLDVSFVFQRLADKI